MKFDSKSNISNFPFVIKAIILLIFATSLFFMSKTTVQAASYGADWRSWSQKASDYPAMRKSGCRIVSYAKMLKAAGYIDDPNFTPDTLFDWCVARNYVNPNSCNENQKIGVIPNKYAAQYGKEITNKRIELPTDSNAKKETIINYSKQGYYILLFDPYESEMHTTYVDEKLTRETGTLYVDDSVDGILQVNDKICGHSFSNYTAMRIFTIEPLVLKVVPQILKCEADPYGSSSSLYVYLSDIADFSRLECTTWTDKNGKDDAVTEKMVFIKNAVNYGYSYYSIDASKHNNEGGLYHCEVRAYNTDERYSSHEITFYLDTEAPTISDVRVDNITATGFDLSCIATDYSQIDSIIFGVFPTDATCLYTGNKYPDEQDLKAKLINGRYHVHVNISDFDLWIYGYQVPYIITMDEYGNTELYNQGSDYNSILVEPIKHIISIKLDKTNLTMKTGQTTKLNASILGISTSTNIGWDSENPNIASVEDGVVVAKAPGTTRINAYCMNIPNIKATCWVTVTNPTEQQKNNYKTVNPTVVEGPKSKPNGSEITLNHIKYVVMGDGEVYLKKLSSNMTSVSVPSTINDDGYTYRVVAIADNAFKNKKKLKSITLGNNIHRIGTKAFYGCSSLKNIKIQTSGAENLSIGKSAFSKTPISITIKLPKWSKAHIKALKKSLKKAGISTLAKFK